MTKLQLIEITPEELSDMIIKGIQDAISIAAPLNEETLLNRYEAAELLKISTVTLWDWTNKGKIQSYALGNKVFYKKSELLKSLKPVKNV